MDYIIEILVKSMRINKKLEKYTDSDQLGWIADFFLIIRRDTKYCTKGEHEISSKVK